MVIGGSVEARYLFGSPVAGGAVVIRARSGETNDAEQRLRTEANVRAPFSLAIPQKAYENAPVAVGVNLRALRSRDERVVNAVDPWTRGPLG